VPDDKLPYCAGELESMYMYACLMWTLNVLFYLNLGLRFLCSNEIAMYSNRYHWYQTMYICTESFFWQCFPCAYLEIQWRDWSTLDLSLMLISAMQHTPSPSAHFSLVLKYFDVNSPLFSFLRFHEEFALRNDFDECKKHLQEFRLSIDKVQTIIVWMRIGG